MLICPGNLLEIVQAGFVDIPAFSGRITRGGSCQKLRNCLNLVKLCRENGRLFSDTVYMELD